MIIIDTMLSTVVLSTKYMLKLKMPTVKKRILHKNFLCEKIKIIVVTQRQPFWGIFQIVQFSVLFFLITWYKLSGYVIEISS